MQDSARFFECQGLRLWPETGEGPEFRCRFSVEATHPWVSGHFPGNPVLPAFAQVALVRRCTEQFLGQEVEMVRVTKTRFQSMIAPGMEVRIVLEVGTDPGSVRWRIDGPEGLCSQGTFHYGLRAKA